MSLLIVCPSPFVVCIPVKTLSALQNGSFENEALENEDRSTKHPKLENEAPKIENEAPKTRKRSTQDRKRSTQDRKRSTQNSKTKHPKLENEAPKKLDTGLSFINTRPM